MKLLIIPDEQACFDLFLILGLENKIHPKIKIQARKTKSTEKQN